MTSLPYFTGITTHLRLLRHWLLDGSGGLDLYLPSVYQAPGWIACGTLLALALACGAAVWLAQTDGAAGSRPSAEC